ASTALTRGDPQRLGRGFVVSPAVHRILDSAFGTALHLVQLLDERSACCIRCRGGEASEQTGQRYGDRRIVRRVVPYLVERHAERILEQRPACDQERSAVVTHLDQVTATAPREIHQDFAQAVDGV